MRLTLEQLEFFIGQIKSCKAEYPKANVYYDCEEQRVLVVLPMPEDDFKITSIEKK